MIPIKQFVLAGKAVFTITDNTSGRHFTYRVNKAAKPRADGGSNYFVSLGISYEGSVYMGMLFPTAHAGVKAGSYHFKMTHKSAVGRDSPSYRVFVLFWDAVLDGTIDELTTLTFRHEGKCCMCARPLTNPESIDAGIGPECAGKIGE